MDADTPTPRTDALNKQDSDEWAKVYAGGSGRDSLTHYQYCRWKREFAKIEHELAQAEAALEKAREYEAALLFEKNANGYKHPSWLELHEDTKQLYRDRVRALRGAQNAAMQETRAGTTAPAVEVTEPCTTPSSAAPAPAAPLAARLRAAAQESGYGSLMDEAAAALEAAQVDGLWKAAALRLGEQLSSVGPAGYYNMAPTEWLGWCKSIIDAEVRK